MDTPYRPQLTSASRPLTFEVEAINERGEAVPTPIAGEHPLTLYLDKREIVTLMTLGQAPEALTIGYLRNQRLVGSIEDIAAVQVDWETDSVAVTTRKGVKGLDDKLKKRTVTTGCGQGTVFGDLMEEIDTIKLRDDVRLPEETLYALLDTVRRHETIYKSAGAVHGCALAAGADILYFVEDVGHTNGWRMDDVVSAREIVSMIGREFPLEQIDPNYTGEVAERWRYRDGGGEIGVIASVTQAFCRDCTRARISTEGKLYTCLFATAGHDLRAPLRGGATDDEIRESIAAIWTRRDDRYSEIRTSQTTKLEKIEMSYIGG